MDVLTILSIIYAAIVVPILAITVSWIILTLVSVDSALGGIADGLKVVERQTAPMEGHMEAINEGLSAIAGGFRSVEGHLVAADASLGKVADRLGARQPLP